MCGENGFCTRPTVLIANGGPGCEVQVTLSVNLGRGSEIWSWVSASPQLGWGLLGVSVALWFCQLIALWGLNTLPKLIMEDGRGVSQIWRCRLGKSMSGGGV